MKCHVELLDLFLRKGKDNKFVTLKHSWIIIYTQTVDFALFLHNIRNENCYFLIVCFGRVYHFRTINICSKSIYCRWLLKKLRFNRDNNRFFAACSKGLEEDEGPQCKVYLQRYYWDNQLQRCVMGVYGGCGATANNFEDLDSCEKAASKYCLNR